MPYPYFADHGLYDVMQAEYVVWIDGMGSASALQRSVSRAANFVMKFHSALAHAAPESSHIYPVMDGAYVAIPDRDDVICFIGQTMNVLADLYVNTEERRHRLAVRAGVAFGPTVHGRDIPDDNFAPPDGDRRFLEQGSPQQLDALLLSSAMPQAYAAEAVAPPFGVVIHESAMAGPALANLEDTGFADPWFHWARDENAAFVRQLLRTLDWCSRHGEGIGYSPTRADTHLRSAKAYFGANRFSDRVVDAVRSHP